jgi:hypothetical protein
MGGEKLGQPPWEVLRRREIGGRKKSSSLLVRSCLSHKEVSAHLNAMPVSCAALHAQHAPGAVARQHTHHPHSAQPLPVQPSGCAFVQDSQKGLHC